MNKALTVVAGMGFAFLLVGMGFALGVLAEMRYPENEIDRDAVPDYQNGHDPEHCQECANNNE